MAFFVPPHVGPVRPDLTDTGREERGDAVTTATTPRTGHPTGDDRPGTDPRETTLPCRAADDADLWFAESPAALEHAKSLCEGCPVRTRCLQLALDRAEPWGVWGGEILDRGVVVARKRPRGRPRKDAA